MGWKFDGVWSRIRCRLVVKHTVDYFHFLENIFSNPSISFFFLSFFLPFFSTHVPLTLLFFAIGETLTVFLREKIREIDGPRRNWDAPLEFTVSWLWERKNFRKNWPFNCEVNWIPQLTCFFPVNVATGKRYLVSSFWKLFVFCPIVKIWLDVDLFALFDKEKPNGIIYLIYQNCQSILS